jgi:hypothetical protein
MGELVNMKDLRQSKEVWIWTGNMMKRMDKLLNQKSIMISLTA